MPRAKSLLPVLLLFLALPSLYSQEVDWPEYEANAYSSGSMAFSMNLGVLFPTVFTGIDSAGHGLSLGGTGFLGFNYYHSPRVFLGAELGAMFSSTRQKNNLFIIPLGARIGYQFIFRRIEVPVSIMVGGAWQNYLDYRHFGLILKPGASVFWRHSYDWSFGLNTFWWVVPQWSRDGSFAMGNFLELTLSARYHIR